MHCRYSSNFFLFFWFKIKRQLQTPTSSFSRGLRRSSLLLKKSAFPIFLAYFQSIIYEISRESNPPSKTHIIFSNFMNKKKEKLFYSIEFSLLFFVYIFLQTPWKKYRITHFFTQISFLFKFFSIKRILTNFIHTYIVDEKKEFSWYVFSMVS